MFLHVLDAKYVRDYVLWLRFNDGTEGEIDLSCELDGEMFAPLKDKGLFRQFRVDEELETVVWVNGADFAPEFLHEKTRVLGGPTGAAARVAEGSGGEYRTTNGKSSK